MGEREDERMKECKNETMNERPQLNNRESFAGRLRYSGDIFLFPVCVLVTIKPLSPSFMPVPIHMLDVDRLQVDDATTLGRIVFPSVLS